MIPRLSYLGMPYYNRYSRYGYRYPYYSYKKANENYLNNSKHELNFKDKYEVKNRNTEIKNDRSKSSFNFKYNSTPDGSANSVNSDKQDNSNNDVPLFQFFGINLYFDDILLICLIWFLYDEGVKDEGLFIALILLLLS